MLLLESNVNVFQLFVSGGYGPMSVISILLIGMFFAAWKAPAWVKEIGLFALAFGIMWTIIGFIQIASILQATPDEISPNVIWGGVKVALIPIVYGFIVYLISLILRIIQKPRI